jgi:hypothetical protein
MAYDDGLAERVRELLAGEPALIEKAMFGGLAFLLGGNMSVWIVGEELLVRVGPEAVEDALTRPHTRGFDMAGRRMRGWILVAPEGIEDDDELGAWVTRGVAFAGSLPAKE